MSCQLKIFAKFNDISASRKYLFPNISDDVQQNEELQGWDDPDWGWQDTEKKSEEVANNHSWLQECHVSVSPAADVIALARGDRLVLLAQKWDSSEEDVPIKYHSVFEGVVRQEEGETVTCVLCLPLASQKRSTQGGPDWTCILVGFSSGYVRMYTETGALLLSQIFSEDEVQHIKCRTYEPPRHSCDAEKHEELTILYRQHLVTIDGFSFFQSLRACRNQVARAAASGSDVMQPPPLAYKKWALRDQERTMDHAPCGVVSPTPFDQLSLASLYGGPAGTISRAPPAAHLYITTGRQPYAGFYYAMEGSAQPMLSDVAHAVASKLKSALFSQISAASGWFGLGSKPGAETQKEKKQKPKIEPATSLPSRFGLPDKRRAGEAVSVSPDCRLAATTDSFGRVALLDVGRGVAVRMWKGYRDAQVGWLEVREDAAREQQVAPPRHALFLVIYAPRRGILEVWTCQQGPRVAAFNVSKKCRLLCPTYGMMGLNNVTYKEVKVNLNQFFLLDPDGSVKVMEIPFHLALSDKNSKRARDMHLLKKLKLILKENSSESGALQTEVIDSLLDIRFASIRQQGVDRVLHTKYLSVAFMQTVLKAAIQQLQTQGELQCEEASADPDADEAEMDVSPPPGEPAETPVDPALTTVDPAMTPVDPVTTPGSLDYDSRSLLASCQAQQHLLNTFSALSKLNKADDGQDLAEVADEQLCTWLGVSPAELSGWRRLLDDYSASLPLDSTRVRFRDDTAAAVTVTDFLGCFCCHAPDGKTDTMTVALNTGLTDSRTLRLASFVFKRMLQHGPSSDFNILLKNSHVAPEDLMKLLLELWLSDDRRQLTAVLSLLLLVKSISSLKDLGSVCGVSSSDVSPWWQAVRDRVSASPRLAASFLAAVAARAVANDNTKLVMTDGCMETSSTSSNLDLSEWEAVTHDKESWLLLTKQLEDLLSLQTLLNVRQPSILAEPRQPADRVSVSVKKVLDGGRGGLAEFVAKWIASEGILPGMLCLEVEGDEEVATPDLPNPSPIVAQLQRLQRRLPHSLDSDVLMANCAWEYAVVWNKDPEVIFPLEQAVAFLKCVQNALLQHGVASMMWHMFLLKRLSATALLTEKVGKAPKDRLCRRDIGLSETSTEKFVELTLELLDTILQTCPADVSAALVIKAEDGWLNVQGPTSLAELALEQKELSRELVEHHYVLAVMLHAVLSLRLRSTRPLSLFDTKGKNAFFKPLHSSPMLPSRIVDEAILDARKQFMCRVISAAVLSLEEPPPAAVFPLPGSPPRSESSNRGSSKYQRWPGLMLHLARDLAVDLDPLRRHHVCELYNGGHDKLAEEVLLTVSDHACVGSALLSLAGRRLHHFVFACDPPVDRLAACSPAVTAWLKAEAADAERLRCPNPPLSDTAALLGHAVNQLPEEHAEYGLALQLADLITYFL